MHWIQSNSVRSPSHHALSPISESQYTVSMHHLQFPNHVHICAYVINISAYTAISTYICAYLFVCLYLMLCSYVYICAYYSYLAVNGSKWQQRAANHSKVPPSHCAPGPNHVQCIVHICAYAVNIHPYWFVSDLYQCIYAHIYLYMCISVYISKLQFEDKPP